MARTWIKICGIRDRETALAAAKAGADAIGLVFADGSPRKIIPAEAKAIVEALPDGVEPIGLFVDVTRQQIIDVCREAGLRTVQLHGHETPHFVRDLQPLRVIKAVHLSEETGTHVEMWCESCANLAALLWDAPPGTSGRGGSGQTFDWHGLARVQGEHEGLPPTVIAGGLRPDNVAEAMKIVRPYGVDVSSGVESTRGVKVVALIHRFCDAVRRAE